MKRKLKSALVLGTLTLLSSYLTGCGTKPVTALPPLAVKTEQVQLMDLPSGESYLGSVTPYVQTVVASSMSGILSSVNVRVGDKIQSGQLLANLNTDLLQAQKNQAAANVGVAASQQDATAQSSQNSLSQAKAALETAETNLANAQSGANSSVNAGQSSLNTQVSQAESAVASAQKALDTAQTQLQNAVVNNQNDITQKQSALASAQANLDAAQKQQAATLSADAQNVAAAQDSLNTASTALASAEQSSHSTTAPALLQAQQAYDTASTAYQNALSRQKQDQASGAVTVAQANYNQAESNLQTSQNSKTVATAQAQVAQAQQALAAAQANEQNLTNQAQANLGQTQTSAQNSVAAAKAAVAQAQVNYETLLNNPQLKVNAAQLEASQAGVQVVEAQINQGQIVSPISGYVVAVNAQAGQAVGPQGGFITIASMDPLTATVDVPETSIGNMKLGMPMSVYVPAVKETLDGSVSAIHPEPDSTNKKYSIEVTLQNAKTTLLPGMMVEAHAVKQGQKGIVIPADSVIALQSGGLSVFTVNNGIAHSVIVKVGSMTDSVYEITSGLKVGDEVVVQGQNLLSDGDKVKVVNGQAATIPAKSTTQSTGTKSK